MTQEEAWTSYLRSIDDSLDFALRRSIDPPKRNQFVHSLLEKDASGLRILQRIIKHMKHMIKGKHIEKSQEDEEKWKEDEEKLRRSASMSELLDLFRNQDEGGLSIFSDLIRQMLATQEAIEDSQQDDEYPEKHERPLDKRPLDENQRKMLNEMDRRIKALGMDTRTVLQALVEFKRQRAAAGNSAGNSDAANEFSDMITSLHEPLFRTLPKKRSPEEELERSASTDVSNEAERQRPGRD